MAKAIDTLIDPVTAAIDPVVEMLVASGVRVTRKNYIDFAYPEAELDAESEAIIREALRNHRARMAAEKAIQRARRRR